MLDRKIKNLTLSLGNWRCWVRPSSLSELEPSFSDLFVFSLLRNVPFRDRLFTVLGSVLKAELKYPLGPPGAFSRKINDQSRG